MVIVTIKLDRDGEVSIGLSDPADPLKVRHLGADAKEKWIAAGLRDIEKDLPGAEALLKVAAVADGAQYPPGTDTTARILPIEDQGGNPKLLITRCGAAAVYNPSAKPNGTMTFDGFGPDVGGNRSVKKVVVGSLEEATKCLAEQCASMDLHRSKALTTASLEGEGGYEIV